MRRLFRRQNEDELGQQRRTELDLVIVALKIIVSRYIEIAPGPKVPIISR